MESPTGPARLAYGDSVQDHGRRGAGVAEAAERGKLVPAIGRIVPLSEAISAVVEL